ncbi:hypothetical protein ACIPN8_42660 [Streptomyces sp. NPDC086082]
MLTVLTLDIPADRDLATAFALDRASGFDLETAYRQVAAVWTASCVTP